MIKQYLLLAWGSLKNRRLRSWLTMLGVIIGIAAVISLIGLGEGLRSFVTGQFSVADADTISIQASGVASAGPPGTGVVDPLTKRELDEIRDVKGVETAVGRVIQSAIFEYNDLSDVAFIISIPDGRYRKDTYDIANYNIDKGRLLKDGDTSRVVVGADYADEEDLGKPIEVGSKITIEEKDYTVVGILEKKGSFTQDSAMIMNEGQLRDQFDPGSEEYDIIAARAADGQDPREIKKDIEKVLRKVRHVEEGEEDFSVETSESALQSLNDTLFAIQLFVYIIAGISILVGGIGIMNTMYTAVLERTKEIGILKAIGAKNSSVFSLFFIESGLIGMVGGIMGIIIGAGAAYGLAAAAGKALGQDMIRAQISLWLVFATLLFSFLVGTIAGVLPARNASKLSPVDALSKER